MTPWALIPNPSPNGRRECVLSLSHRRGVRGEGVLPILPRQPRDLQQAVSQHVLFLQGQGALLDLREAFPTSFMARMMVA